MDSIGLIGVGFVGSCILNSFSKVFEVNAHDPKISGSTIQDVLSSKVCFVCVPTPTANRLQDLSILKSVCRDLKTLGYKGVVVIKSTVVPGTCEQLAKLHKLKIVHNPEFLTERNAQYDFEHQTAILLGGSRQDTKVVAAAYNKVFPGKEILCYSKCSVTEMAKYVHNVFLAMKVGFFNDIYDVCQSLKVPYDSVLSAALSQKKIINSHTNVPGPDGKMGYGGTCLLGTAKILSKTGNKISLKNIKEANIGDLVLSYADSEGPVFKPITEKTARPYIGKMVTFKTRMGKFIKCTDDHPLLVKGDGGLEIKLAKDLMTGDLIPSFRGSWEYTKSEPIDLLQKIIESGSFDLSRVRLRIVGIDRTLLKPEISPSRIRDFMRSNCLTANEFLKIEHKLPKIIRSSIRIFTSRGNTTEVPAIYWADEALCSILGYYVSEGCISKEKGLRGDRHRIKFSFNEDENEYLTQVATIMEQYGIKYTVQHSLESSSKSIIVSSRAFAFLLEGVLGCGTDSYTVRVPDIIYSVSDSLKLQFLRCAFRGDGCIELAGVNSITHDYGTVSKDLLDGMLFLYHCLGIIPGYKVSRSAKSTCPALHLRVSGKDQILQLKNFKDAETENIVDEVLGHCKSIKPMGYSTDNLLFYTPVTDISTSEETLDVYSIEVADTHNFITDFGIVVHNCFPKDTIAFLDFMGSLGLDGQLIDALINLNRKRRPEYDKLLGE